MGKSNIKYTIDEVREIVESKGYKFLDNVYNGIRSHINVVDDCGYFYYTTLYQLLKSPPCIIHKANIHSIKNIKKWLIDNDKTIDILSEKYIGKNTTMLLWKCLKENCGKTFDMAWERMLDSGNCPHCSSKFVNKFNNLEYLYPELAKQWHETKNGNLKPNQFTSFNSSDKVWWRCPKNPKHEWQSKISNRHIRGCPYCAGTFADDEYNLRVYFPEICKEWDYYNNATDPSKYTPYSNHKVWWICKTCEHTWNANISSRTMHNTNCPACANQCVTEENSLLTKNPKLTKEWNSTKNGDMTPKDLTWGSNKKVWWECSKCSHEWIMTPAARNNGRGCPRCNLSRGENTISCILDKHNIFYIPQYKFEGCINILTLHFDFYLPHHNLAIEFQGGQHYKSVKFFGGEEKLKYQQQCDQIKRDYCINNEINLLEIPYWDFDNIEEILVKELKNYN